MAHRTKGILGKVTCLGELTVYGKFSGELCLIMTGFDRGQRLGLITAVIWDANIGWN